MQKVRFSLILLSISALFLTQTACTTDATSATSDETLPAKNTVQKPKPIIPPLADGFDFPVGPPDAKG
ncbi:MAG: hypothetical protein AAF570_19795, partial [Bacteroidota bacterium]